VYSSSQKRCQTTTGNSHAIWDHTVLPDTRQRWESHLYPQPEQVLDLVTLEGCKAELTCVTDRPGLNPRSVNHNSDALQLSHYATRSRSGGVSSNYQIWNFEAENQRLWCWTAAIQEVTPLLSRVQWWINKLGQAKGYQFKNKWRMKPKGTI